jgi:hypothetical protein
MKTIFLIIFLAINLPLITRAQFSMAYQAGYGTYRMKSLSEYQEFVLKGSDFPAEIVTQFPGYINHKLIIGLPFRAKINKIYVGYLTTAGRISLTDYSGKWTFDQTLNGFQAGCKGDYPIKQFKDFELSGYLDFGFTTTVMKLYQYLSIADQKFEESYLFVAYGVNIQPGLQLSFIRPTYSLSAFTGYEQDFSRPFFKKGSPKIKLGTSAQNLSKPEWAGLRTGIEICLKIGK